MRCAVVLLVFLAVNGSAQYRRRVPIEPTNPSGAVKDVQGTLHGKLKLITNKEIVFQNGDDQSVSVRRTRKTRFMKDGKEIKPSSIEPDTAVSIDVVQDIDLKPMAITVTVDSARKASAQQ